MKATVSRQNHLPLRLTLDTFCETKPLLPAVSFYTRITGSLEESQRNASIFREKLVRRSHYFEALAVVSDENEHGETEHPVNNYSSYRKISRVAIRRRYRSASQSNPDDGSVPAGAGGPGVLLSRIRLSLSKCDSVGIDYVNAQSASLHVHSKCLTKRAPGG